MSEKLLDVVEVEIASGKVLGFMGEGKTERNAEAIVMMAVMRRGVETCFYAEVPAGSLKVGERYVSPEVQKVEKRFAKRQSKEAVSACKRDTPHNPRGQQ